MENNGFASIRLRNSPSSERFLSLFSQSHHHNPNNYTPTTSSSIIGEELEEDDVFWTGNFSQSDHKSDTSRTLPDQNHNSLTFKRVDSSGILAALPEDNLPKKKNNSLGENRLLCRKISLPSSTSSTRMIPAIPKPQSSDREFFFSVPSGNNFRNFRHSAPVNVPMRPQKGKRREIMVDEVSDDDDSDKEMLPPHEIVARGSGQADMTFSVLEGVGRTLKGRDLRQVRNAVWRQTGFLD